MARVYKEFKQNGKAIKKWVDEYIAFEFDEDGNIINDTSEYGDNADEYDANGNRTELPWWFDNDGNRAELPWWFENDRLEPIFKSDNLLYTFDWWTRVNIEKLGNQVIKVDEVFEDEVFEGFKTEIVWNTNNGTEIYSLDLGYVDLESFKKEFDEDNNLIYLKNDNSEYFFEYDENKLIHLKRIDSDCSEDDEDKSFEEWFEYDGEKIEHSKSSVESETFYRYDSKGRLVCRVFKKIWQVEDDNDDDWSDDDDENDTGVLVRETEYEYDSNGNLLHKVSRNFDSKEDYEEGNFSSIASEIKYAYDSNNKMIFAQSGECITKWDSFGNIIYEKNLCGEYKNEYNSNGQLIHSIHKIPQGEREVIWPSDAERNYEKKWNDNGKLVFTLYSNKKEIFEYNENNKLIHYISFLKNKDNEDSKHEEWCEYNDGVLVLIHKKWSYGNEDSKQEGWCEYNDGVLIHEKYSNGAEYKYNSQGKLIYYRGSDLEPYWIECDSNGNLIHFKSDEVEEWYEYELYDNGNIKKKICYRAI